MRKKLVSSGALLKQARELRYRIHDHTKTRGILAPEVIILQMWFERTESLIEQINLDQKRDASIT